MHRPGRVGADIFDVDRPPPRSAPAPEIASPCAATARRHRSKASGLQPDVEEAGPGDFGRGDVGALRAGSPPAPRRARAGSSRAPSPPWRRPSPRWSRDRRARRRAAARRRSGRDRARGAARRPRSALSTAAATRAWKSAKMFINLRRRRNAAAGPYRKSRRGVKKPAYSLSANRSVMPAI